MDKKIEKFIDEVNKQFPNKSYPLGIILKDGKAIVSGESLYKESITLEDGEVLDCEATLIDYYGEFRGGYPWINPKLEELAKKMGIGLEWQNPACLDVYVD